MDTAGPSAEIEKARLQQQYEASNQQPALAELPTSPEPVELPASPAPALAVPGGSNAILDQDIESPADTYHETSLVPHPPPYSGPSSSQVNTTQRATPKGPQKYPGLPRLDYRLYSPPLFDLSADRTAIKSTAPYLSSNVSALVSLVRAQASVPPKPQVHISGKRGRKVDFAVQLNLMSLLVPDDPRMRMDYIRCVADGEPALRGGYKPSVEPEVGDGGLEEWARRFIEDPGPVKSFALERVVANMDIEWLEGQIRSMIASTDYKGVVTVTFPVTHARVVVQNPDKVNKFFTSVTTLFSGKRKFEVVKAVWPFATHRNGEPGRRCIVQSEETWWKEWKDSIKYAVSTQRQGWVTNEDKLEAIMEGVGKGVSTVDWGPDY